MNIPEDLPQIEDEQGGDEKDREAAWEKRATVLVQKNPQFAQSSSTRSQTDLKPGQMPRSRSSSSVGDQQDDVRFFFLSVRGNTHVNVDIHYDIDQYSGSDSVT